VKDLLDESLYSLDPHAETATWRDDGISALRRRIRSAGLPYRIVIDNTRTHAATLVDTFDWRLLAEGKIALLLEDEADRNDPVGSERSVRGSHQLRVVHHSYQRKRRTLGEVSRGDSAGAPPPVPINPIAPIGRSPHDICDCTAPRALLQMGGAELSIRRGRLVNRTGKTEAIVDEIGVGGTPKADAVHGVRHFLLLRPLRGYCRAGSVPLGAPVGLDGMIDALAAGAGRRPFDFETRLNLPIRSDDDPVAAHRHVVTRLAGTMAVVRPGIGVAGDPEFLHDYRVALRRLRSYLKEAGLGPPPMPATTNRNGRAVERIDAIWKATGTARDFDVFLERRSRYIRLAPEPLRREVEHLFDRIGDLRDASYATLLAHLPVGYETDLERELLTRGPAWGLPRKRGSVARSPSTPGFEMQGSETQLDRQAARWVRRREKRFRDLVKRLQQACSAADSEIDDEMIHATRRAAKKYRYLQEIFHPVLDDRRKMSKRGKQLRKLQNLLGSYNDLVVEEARFHAILVERDEASYGEVRAATAYMLAQVEREKLAARERVLNELSKEVK
jgi:CHAD domain-containing protein